jgi:hypothetical protein
LAAAQLGADNTATSHAQGVLSEERKDLVGDEGIIIGRGPQVGQVAGTFIKTLAQQVPA